jgi:8-oxo-dGTP pyrophosphatase MutT (NUDIX family)
MPGHITGSAWIIDEDKTHVLLIHHNNLNRWLQPGGHADGDENVLNVAIREANEETGLLNLTLLTSGVFDLDIHPIPERKGFPSHFHYDVRFLFRASKKDELKISEESSDLKWIKLSEVPALTQNNPSILRMIKKLTTSN